MFKIVNLLSFTYSELFTCVCLMSLLCFSLVVRGSLFKRGLSDEG